MRRILAWSVAVATAAMCSVCDADVRLPHVFGSHMVLQRDAKLPVWGWADAGEEVTVQLGDEKQTATADADGKWSVKLSERKAGGPHRMTVTGNNKIELQDILIGEVWVCSGQSNMEWRVAVSDHPKEEIAAAKYPKIRLFHVQRRPSLKPIDDAEVEWKACTPQSIPSFTAVGYFFGRKLHKELDVPVGLIQSAWGGTRIEPWTPPVGFEQVEKLGGIAKMVKERDPDGKKPNQQQPSVLYNGMVHHLVPFAIRGAIWYQGESNRGEGMLYYEKMKALIGGWRSVWKQGDFPFLFVQLAPYRYRGDELALPGIWEAQTAALKIKNTGMAVTTDIGNVNDIHPRNKQDVGKRLALWALANTYEKKDLVFSGPLYKSMAVEENRVRVKFDHVGGGLESRDGKPLSHFEVAGADGVFRKATAKIDDGEVIVSSDAVAKPTSVRFGWHQLAEPNLMNKAGLPASPFIAKGK